MSSDRAMDTTIMTGSQRVTRAGYGTGRDEAEKVQQAKQAKLVKGK